ncbi:hypothetical protein ENUP19_0320G0005 [Entamoeba nuttalli]|uniref:Uncharacterized protein n=1 Tax=Entamoeba nuttalli TaxID=412467 RepID=A0ABQ0DW86_9EUKA
MIHSKTKNQSIKVTVIHSHIGGKSFWKDLNKNWKKYGETKIKLSVKFIKKEITLKELQKQNPDIIVCSDTAGSPSSFSANEVIALETFLKNSGCKHLLGTYALFQHLEQRTNGYDNRKICHLFGINPSMKFGTINLEQSISYCPINPGKSILWNNLELPYVSDGYCHSQVPFSLSWFNDEGRFIGGKDVTVLARNEQGTAVIVYYSTKTYSAVYISTMPEFNTLQTKVDSQFIYNCFMFLVNTNPTLSLQSLCIHQVKKLHIKLVLSQFPPQLFPSIQEHVLKRKKLKRVITKNNSS